MGSGHAGCLVPVRRLLAIAVIAACSGAPAARPGPTDESLATRVDAIWRDAAGDLSGASIAVARGDRVVFARGYGLADREHRIAVGPDTVFRIASVSKQFIAVAVMQLVEQSRVGLDDDITRYLTTFPLQGHRVTVRQLLHHTSGIHNYTDEDNQAAFATPRRWTGDALVETFASHPFDFEPGTRWSYSNSGYLLLALIVEHVTGLSYPDYLSAHVFAAEGLARTFDCGSLSDRPGFARGYQPDVAHPGTFLPMTPPNDGSSYASGSLCSTSLDLVRWQHALHRHSLLAEASYRTLTRPAIVADGRQYPYGFGVALGQLDGHPALAHAGIIEGTRSSVTYYAADGITVIVLANTQSGAVSALQRRVARAALGLPEPTVVDLPVPDAERRALAGSYDVGGRDWTLVIADVDGHLELNARGEPAARLHRQAKGHFIASNAGRDELTFDRDGRSVTIDQFAMRFIGLRQP